MLNEIKNIINVEKINTPEVKDEELIQSKTNQKIT
jgi:hypothetical protein